MKHNAIGWLIERQKDGGPLFYLCRSDWGLMWLSTSEPHQDALEQAIRFVRREDAEAVAAALKLEYTRIAEHSWMPA